MKQKLSHSAPIDFDAKQLTEILQTFSSFSAPKNTILLRAGTRCNELYFILNGCVRTYFIDEEGFEKTSSITLDNNFTTAWTSFISQNPSIEYIEVIEDTEFLAISHQELHSLVKANTNWKEFYFKLLEIAFLNQSRKIEALMTLNAKQRYQKLINGNPKLIQSVSNKIVASFLHMREETLSRLKSKR
jgi:CRP-like cAMP-binding protein